MAANDYYQSYNPNMQNTHNQDTSYLGGAATVGSQGYGRTNAPLPPVPVSSSSSSLSKPFKADSSYPPPAQSPFDDNSYPQYPHPSQQHDSGRQSPHYYGAPGNINTAYTGYNNDPFNDSNAIPLKNQGKDQTKYGNGGYGVSSPTGGAGFAEQYGGQRPPAKQEREQGWFKGKITWACYILFLIQVTVFIVELVRNSQLQGTPISTKPTFNPMLGPSAYALINMGARFPPCMKDVHAIIDTNGNKTQGPLVKTLPINCPNSTSTTDSSCSLAELCGFGMDLSAGQMPNQWWRFITPIFLHGGIIHIGFNMLLQLTLGRDMEILIGTIRFVLIYFSAGIFANIFAGNFAPNGLPSTGASGALFAIIALTLLDLLYSWRSRKSPGKELAFIGLDIVIAFVLGLLPGLDNFAHIGGFLTGLMLGLSLLRSPDTLRQRVGLDEPKYGTLSPGDEFGSTKGGVEGLRNFTKQPVGFFKGRKPLWWGWWLVRAGFLTLFIVVFAVLLNNFYTNAQTCSWCKYLSCLPVNGWCNIGNIEYKTTTTVNKRSFEDMLRLARLALSRN